MPCSITGVLELEMMVYANHSKGMIIGISNMNLIRFNVASLRTSNNGEGVYYKAIQHVSEHRVRNAMLQLRRCIMSIGMLHI